LQNFQAFLKNIKVYVLKTDTEYSLLERGKFSSLCVAKEIGDGLNGPSPFFLP